MLIEGKQSMPVRHIIWDWNGTLLDDVQACVDAINVLLERRHLPTVTRDQYRDIFDFPVRDYYLKLGFNLDMEDWHGLATEYHEVYASTSSATALRPGTIEALDRFRSSGVSLSVLSACELTLLRRMMEERGILNYFDHIYGLSDLYAHSKLSLGHDMLNTTGLPRAESLLVGDTTHDAEVAAALGISCLLMTGGHQSPAKLRCCSCPMVPDMDSVYRHLNEAMLPL
jgi:phosphoglycolate phosphatase